MPLRARKTLSAIHCSNQNSTPYLTFLYILMKAGNAGLAVPPAGRRIKRRAIRSLHFVTLPALIHKISLDGDQKIFYTPALILFVADFPNDDFFKGNRAAVIL